MKCPIPGCPGKIATIYIYHNMNFHVYEKGKEYKRGEQVSVTCLCEKKIFHTENDDDRIPNEMQPRIWELPKEVFDLLPEHLKELSKKSEENYLKERAFPKKF